MHASQLRALQTPLKEKYRSTPQAALITLRAKGSLDDTAIACKVETGRALAVAGLHPATGGSGAELCSGEILLEKADVFAEGDLDFRGTLGVDKEARVGFQAIRLRFEVSSSAPQEKLEQLFKLTERYCVVLQTLKGSAALSATLNNTPPG